MGKNQQNMSPIPNLTLYRSLLIFTRGWGCFHLDKALAFTNPYL